MSTKGSGTELNVWLELDLTAAAARGELRPAFEIEALYEQVLDVIEAGRHLILVGESGVGKTALIHELVRRLPAQGPAALRDCRVLQLSFARRVAGLASPDKMRPAMQKLVEELVAAPGIVPFFRDVHLAMPYNLQAQLLGLMMGASRPVLAEGDRQAVAAMLEDEPDLAQQCVVLEIEEPSLDRTLSLLTAWSNAQARSDGPAFEPEALVEAAYLSHRFLARARLPRKALNLLSEVSSLLGERTVTRTDVIERFCRAHRVPPLLVDPSIQLQLGDLRARLGGQVLGQDEAVDAMVRMVGMIKAGLSDVRRPFGVFLFVGPTGVGKTHLAQTLAQLLFGSRDRMVRINMADFPKEEDALVLMGNPEAYPPSLKRGLLTRRLLGHPFAVVLFDEFEKANEKVHDRLLQLMDEGAFINGAGETVSCRSCVLIATSNAGAELYRSKAVGFSAASPADMRAMDREVDRRLLQRFRFEFLNRFDEVVHFHPLAQEHIRTIAQRELEELARRSGLVRKGLRLEADESVLDWLAVQGYDPLYGARVLRRTIERHVAVALAEVIVRLNPPPCSTLELTVRRHGPEVHVRASAPPPPARTPVALTFGSSERVLQLDPERLAGEGQRLLELARPRRDWLEARKLEREALLDSLNQQGGWDGAGDGGALLPRYRELDKVIRTAQHLLRPLDELQTRLAAGGARDLVVLARALERAAEAGRRWEEQLAEAAPSGTDSGAAWMVVSTADPLHPATDWLNDLVKLEQHWLSRLQLGAAVVACEISNERLVRVVLDVDGPGAAFYLGMERGLHRFSPARGAVQKARVDVIPKQLAAVPHPTSPVRKRSGPFGLSITCRVRVPLAERGVVVELLGAEPQLLGRLARDLELAAADSLTAALDVARVYGESGGGAHDPRTGARVKQLKDALKGKLDPLLEAWRARPPAGSG